MADDSDVPPLEDMTEMLTQIQVLKDHKKSTSSIPQNKTVPVQSSVDQSQNKGDSQNSKKVPTKQTKPSDEKPKASGFAGMKKGFLFGSSSSTKKSNPQKPKSPTVSSESDIPFIKANPQAASNQLPEVQAAMEIGQQFAQNREWVTDDLLGKIQKSPDLFKKLSDPSFMAAITEFQTNPQAASQKYQNNPEMQKFLKEFCGLMGDHFSNLPPSGEQQTAKNKPDIVTNTGADISVHSSTNPRQATAEDERKMQNLLSDPEIREVLLDERVQKLVESLRTDPDRAQQTLRTLGPDMMQKIKKLVDAGILQFQR